MSKLRYRQEKIQEKRKKTPRRQFVKEVCSRSPIVLHRNNGHISVYPESNRSNITSLDEYQELGNDTFSFEVGPESFLEKLQDFISQKKIPSLLHYGNNVNASFADSAINVKNVYISFLISSGSENVLYSFLTREASRNVFNCVYTVSGSENVYSCLGTIQSYNVFYSKYITNSSNIWFSSSLTGCTECLMCHELENQSYCIQNKQYTKEEYLKEKKRILTDKEKFQQAYESIDVVGKNHNSSNVSGSFVIQSENIENGYAVFNAKKGRNTVLTGSPHGGSEWYDFFVGGVGCEHMYGVAGSGSVATHIYCSSGVGMSHNIYYSYFLVNCNYCLGCVGLTNKEFCIFNKQYTKEQRHQKVDKIFAQMEKDGSLGDFFPGSINPFYFNDTVAALIEDFDKDEIKGDGFLRRDEEVKVDIPERMEVVETTDLGDYESRVDNQWTLDPSILKKVIRDEKGNSYRIIKMEYDFLQKHGLPLPRKHRLDRLKGHFRTLT